MQVLNCAAKIAAQWDSLPGGYHGEPNVGAFSPGIKKIPKGIKHRGALLLRDHGQKADAPESLQGVDATRYISDQACLAVALIGGNPGRFEIVS